MTTADHRYQTTLLFVVSAFALLSPLPAQCANEPTTLNVDARDISERVLHATLHIPAAPGPLTLVYPQGLPGEHGPTGPITDLVGLKMSAGGKSVSWRRA